MAEAPASPSLSKKQQRRLAKAQWLADRKAVRLSIPPSASSTVDAATPVPRQHITPQPLAAVVRYSPCESHDHCTVRSVETYLHRFETFAKRRWCGRELLDLFVDEFGLSRSYCQTAIAMGLLQINGQPQAPDYIIHDGDRVLHLVHRHEPSIHLASTTVDKLVHYETDELVVVNKPSGLPVHPSGPYLHNSLSIWLAADRSGSFVPVHRLDRLTSGLTLLAKSTAHASALNAQIAGRSVRKHYVARVIGAFPTADEFDSIRHEKEDGLAAIDKNEDGYWRLEAPIAAVVPLDRHRREVAVEGGKSSTTLFRMLSVSRDGSESVVECVPVTGRTHQIRVHLQFLGFPIANDPLYGPQLDRSETTPVDEPDYDLKWNEDSSLLDRARALCANCHDPSQGEATSECLWLHSYRYEDRDGAWSYQVPLPSWAEFGN